MVVELMCSGVKSWLMWDEMWTDWKVERRMRWWKEPEEVTFELQSLCAIDDCWAAGQVM